MSDESPHVQLTTAEREVLLLVIDLTPVGEIARKRRTSVGTVRSQIASIHRKLNVSTNAEAMLWGIAHRDCCLVLPWEHQGDAGGSQDDVS
ncbi:MAG: response regulator transcription factor [Dehalococcoidia bacterium]|nr:response regulator transcription factor [Dehalococcoidia bacterium]